MISSSLINMIRDQHVEDEEQQQPSYASSSSSHERSSVRIQPVGPLANPEVVHIPVPPPDANEEGFCKKNRRIICLVAVAALLLICITITSTTFVIFAFSESRKNDSEPPPTTNSTEITSPTPPPSSTPTVSSIPTTTTSPTPTPLLARIILSGGFHACAIDVFHKLFCWGWNGNGHGRVVTDYYNLTINQTITSPTAIEVENDPKEISLGYRHSCIIDVLSKVWCWGWNDRGQLGLGDNVDRNAPKEVILVSGAIKIAAGDLHTCIITTLKKLWCWGQNNWGQLGTGTTSNTTNTPVEVVGLNSDISDVSLGWFHTCTLDILSQLYCSGRNDLGQLGLGHKTSQSTPTKVVFENSHVMKVSLGGSHSCIVNNLSQVWCWGLNFYGQIGDGTTTDRTTPTQTSLVTAASQIDVGDTHSCIIDNLSDLWCWGSNEYGQLGLGTSSNKYVYVPTNVTAVDDVVHVSAGHEFTFLVDGNDNIMSMGYNEYGQLGLGDTTSRNTPTRLTGI